MSDTTDFWGQLISSAIGAYTADQAAGANADAIEEASRVSAQAAAQARSDILNTYGPSMQVYQDAINNSMDTIMAGRDSTADIIGGYSNAAGNIINQTAQNAQNAILGVQSPSGMVQAGGPGWAELNPPGGVQMGGSQTAQTPGYGLSQARQDVTGLTGQGLAEAAGGFDTAGQEITTGQQLAGQQLGGYTGQGLAEAAQGFGAAGQEIAAGQQQATQNIVDSTGQALGYMGQAPQAQAAGYDMSGVEGSLGPYTGYGEQAAQKEAALSGSLGPEAQQQAMDAFIESPGQQYLREQQERALLRNQAAIGGLGGGNVRTALQEQAMGIAAGQQQQQLENYRNIAGRGLQAGSQQAGIEGSLQGQQMAGQTGVNLANQAMQGQYGLTGAGMLQGAGSQLAGLATGGAQNQANLAAQAGLTQYGGLAGLGAGLSGLATGSAQDRANLAQQAGLTQYGGLQGLGSQLGGMSTQAGQQMAGIYGGQGQQQLQNVYGAGSQLAGMEQQTAANIANLYAQGGGGMSGSLQNLGINLANLGVGQGAAQSQLQQSLGETEAARILGIGGNIQTGIGGIYTGM